MSYKKASDVLPKELIKSIQQHIDGQYVYIPKVESNKKAWGEITASKKIIENRNRRIYQQYLNGISTKKLTAEYFLAQKTIQRIIREMKKRNL